MLLRTGFRSANASQRVCAGQFVCAGHAFCAGQLVFVQQQPAANSIRPPANAANNRAFFIFPPHFKN